MNISLHYMYGFASGIIVTSIILKRKKVKVKNAKTQTIKIEPAKPMTKTIGIQTDPLQPAKPMTKTIGIQTDPPQPAKRSIEVNTDHTLSEWYSVLPNILSNKQT